MSSSHQLHVYSKVANRRSYIWLTFSLCHFLFSSCWFCSFSVCVLFGFSVGYSFYSLLVVAVSYLFCFSVVLLSCCIHCFGVSVLLLLLLLVMLYDHRNRHHHQLQRRRIQRGRQNNNDYRLIRRRKRYSSRSQSQSQRRNGWQKRRQKRKKTKQYYRNQSYTMRMTRLLYYCLHYPCSTSSHSWWDYCSPCSCGHG